MSSISWVWDSNRKAYYYWSAHDGCFTYQDGTKVPAEQPGQPRDDTRQYATQTLKKNINDSYPNAGRNRGDSTGAGDSGLAYAFDNLNFNTHTNAQPFNPQSHHQQPPQQYASPVTANSPPSPSYLPSASSSKAPFPAAFAGRTTLVTGPPEETTDKDLLAKGAQVRGKIRGTKGNKEKLDKSFFKRDGGRRFFKVGKVIKILWPELPGNRVDGMTVVSDAKFDGENFITKIRWFVVVKEGRESCTCVPISTYGGRGCTKPGLAKWQHCIVHTDKESPIELEGEEPAAGEMSMLSSIPVRSRSRQEKMFPASRINFGKMYTVEHNVKVYDFGDVRQSYISSLVEQWKWVLDCDLMGNGPQNRAETSTPAADYDSGDNEDNTGELETIESDDESEEEAPPVLPAHGTANWEWKDTTMTGQLMFDKNDRIYVMDYSNSAWATGRNESTRLTGSFPQNYVKVDSPDYGTALRENPYDKNKKDRLDFKKGDKILLLKLESNTWDHGRNMRTSREGKYPHEWVKMDRGKFAKASYNYPYDQNKPDQLVFDSGDRILVLDYDNPSKGWARGRNERTRWEGKFPLSYVTF